MAVPLLRWDALPGPVAVVDIETSGLSPDRCRIVEIAILRLSPGGAPAWLDTLVDPQGPVGPTDIHGIRAEDVRGAPRFADLCPAIAALLDGAWVVAHNARFEDSFLAAEVARAGGAWAAPHVCTMRLARRVDPTRRGPGASTLGTLARDFGVTNPAAHRAAGDVLATAGVLAALLDRAGDDAARAVARASREVAAPTRWPTGTPGRALVRPRAPNLDPRYGAGTAA